MHNTLKSSWKLIPELSSFCPCLRRDRSWGCYRYLLAASRWEDAWKRLNTPRGNRASRDRPTPCHSTRLCRAQQSSFQFTKSPIITHSRVEWLSLGSFSRNEFLMRSTPPCALLFFQFLNKANILSWENSAKWKQKMWNSKLFCMRFKHRQLPHATFISFSRIRSRYSLKRSLFWGCDLCKISNFFSRISRNLLLHAIHSSDFKCLRVEFPQHSEANVT